MLSIARWEDTELGKWRRRRLPLCGTIPEDFTNKKHKCVKNSMNVSVPLMDTDLYIL